MAPASGEGDGTVLRFPAFIGIRQDTPDGPILGTIDLDLQVAHLPKHVQRHVARALQGSGLAIVMSKAEYEGTRT